MISDFKAIGFDMDGTLMDSQVDYEKMSTLIFDEMVRSGVPESVINRSQGSKFNIDSGVKYLVENGRGTELYDIEKRIAKAARDIEMEKADKAVPFPDALLLLDELRSKGYKVGVLTRGCREYAEYILGRNDVLGRLDGLVCRDDFPESEAKPSPKAMEHLADALAVGANEIMYVGDHKIDMMCAVSAGSGFIGVLSGGYDEEDWKGLGAETVGTVADLLKMI